MNAIAKLGRPSKFKPELAKEVCERLSAGEPLTVICDDPHMPCDDTVRKWAEIYPDISREIARARVVGHDRIAVRAQKTLRGLGPEFGGESTGDVIRDKAIADFDLKLLAKWDPKRYGDLRRTEISGVDGAAIQIEHAQTLDLGLLDDAQRSALREILEAARANQALDVTPRGGEEE